MINTVSLSIYATDIEITSFLKTVDDLAYRYKPVEMAFDTSIDTPKLVELLITCSSGIGINLFASWLYDKIKNSNDNVKKKEPFVTLNGVSISNKNITVIQIVNIIKSESNHSDS